MRNPHANNNIDNIKIALDNSWVIDYLHKSKGISHELIQRLVIDGLLMQEADTNNAVFKVIDEHGCCVGAELNGTLKGLAEGSTCNYGFNLRYP